MFKGKEDHLDLIRGLRTVHALQGEEQELQKADKLLIMALKKQRDNHRHKVKYTDTFPYKHLQTLKQSHRAFSLPSQVSQEEATHARVVGTELGRLFDILSKELIHLQEERRIHAFTLLAERDRRIREAEESGKRQGEELRRKEEDEIFRQVRTFVIF